MVLAACSATPADEQRRLDGNGVSLRTLADTDVAPPADSRTFALKGALIPTPSDARSIYFPLRQRTAIGGTIGAIVREERGQRGADARTGVDCGKRLFHVLGVGSTRADAEVAIAYDGPLRPIAGLPRRQEIADCIYAEAGTPLAPA